MEDVTDRQQEVLDAIDDLTVDHGYPPSLLELCEALKIKSIHGVSCHLEALRKKGRVTWEPGKSRTLRVLHKGER